MEKALLALFGLMLVSSSASAFQFIVIGDAGSGHTSFFVFKINGTKIEELGECRLEGGLAEFADNVDGISAYLSECQKFLNEKVPAASVSETPLYVGGTAGLRLLQETSPQDAQNVLNGVRLYLKSTGFLFENENVRILRGDEEGLYAHICINIIGSDEFDLSLDALDMGGASAQISYKCSSDHTEGCNDVSLFGEDYKVFSQSMNCYGSGEALKRYVTLLILKSFNEENQIKQIKNPCLTTGGYTRYFSEFPKLKSEIFDSPCTNLTAEFSDFTSAIAALPDDHAFEYLPSFTDAGSCLDVMTGLVDTKECSTVFDTEHSQCFQFDREIPVADTYAISSYYYNFGNLLNIESIGKTEAVEQIEEACMADKQEELDCFKLNYIFAVLTRGYEFSESGFEKIRYAKKIRGKAVSWALGLAATKIGKSGAASAPLSSPVLMIALAAFKLLGQKW